METLLKLQKQRVDEQRRIVKRLEVRHHGILDDLAALDEKAQRERAHVAVDPLAAPTWEAFLHVHLVRKRDLEQQRETSGRALEMAYASLREAFAEQKRYETVYKRRLVALEKRRSQREQTVLDERGLEGFRRAQQE